VIGGGKDFGPASSDTITPLPNARQSSSDGSVSDGDEVSRTEESTVSASSIQLVAGPVATVAPPKNPDSASHTSGVGLLNARDRKELVSRIKALRLDIQAAQTRRQTLGRRLATLRNAFSDSGTGGNGLNRGGAPPSLAVRDSAISAALAAVEESITELDTVIPGAPKSASQAPSPSPELRAVLPPPSQLVPLRAPDVARAALRPVAEVAEDSRTLIEAMDRCIAREEELLAKCLRLLRAWKHAVRVSAAIRIQRLWRGYVARSTLACSLVCCPGAPRTLDMAVGMVVQARRLAGRVTPYEKWTNVELIMEKTSVKRAVARRTARLARKRAVLHPELPQMTTQQQQQLERDLCRPLYQLYSRVKMLLGTAPGQNQPSQQQSQSQQQHQQHQQQHGSGSSTVASAGAATPSTGTGKTGEAEVKAVPLGPSTSPKADAATSTADENARARATVSASKASSATTGTGAAAQTPPPSASGSTSSAAAVAGSAGGTSSSAGATHSSSTPSPDLARITRLLAQPLPATRDELMKFAEVLRAEKRSLQIVLNRFERDFERTHGRKIRFQADILPVQVEWGVYRETKARLAAVTKMIQEDLDITSA